MGEMIRVDVLGPIDLTVGGDRVELTSPRLRKLLAVLAAHVNMTMSSDRLIDLVWADDEPGSDVRTLRTNIWRLRNHFGTEAETVLTTRPGGYSLVLPPDGTDSGRFERLVAAGRFASDSHDVALALEAFGQALELWRGPAFDGFESESWAAPMAVRLEQMRTQTMERRIDLLLDLGRRAEALEDVDQLIVREPLRERPRAQKMKALYQEQRPVEALREYTDYRRLLAEEVGLEPSPELQQLERAVLDHDPALTTQPAPTRVLRGYRLFEVIGATPRTTTYRALAPRSGEAVLLRVVDRAVASEAEYVRGFELEWQRLQSLNHPAVVPVLDCWRDGDGAYFVFPMVDLVADLKELIANGSIGASSVSRALSDGLDALHHIGLVHGEIAAGSIAHADAATPQPAPVVRLLPGGRAAGSSEKLPSQDGAELTALLRAAGVPTHDGPVSPTTRNPYVGLRAFQEVDAGYFFGRTKILKDIIERLTDTGRRGRLLALVGASGSGKSSIVRAGVIPALREGAVPGSIGWFVATVVPGSDPFDTLASALNEVAITDCRAPTMRTHSVPDPLGAWADAMLPAGSELVVVLDQAEELFTSVADDAVRTRFLDLLIDAIDRPGSRLRIILTLRADFYDRPLRYRRFGELLHENHLVVVTMSPDEVRSAIEEPCASLGIALEPGLARALAADYETNPSLPLLQHALAELFDRRVAGRLSLDVYADMGGLAGGLAHRAEAVFVGLDPEQQQLTRRAFTRLVALGEGTTDTRRRVERRELDGLSDRRADADEVIDRFSQARLLTLDHERESRQPTVEIAHEALIVRWGRLAAWLDDDREGVRVVRHVSAAARAWVDSGRDSAELYRGTRLDAVQAWADGHQGDLGSLEREFLSASHVRRLAEERAQREQIALQQRQNRRLRRLLTAAVVAVVVALLAGTAAFVQSRRASDERNSAAAAQRRAESERDNAADAQAAAIAARDRADVDRLVAQSIADANETPDRALLLAAAAFDLDPSAKTAAALQSTITAQPLGLVAFIPATESADVAIGRSVIVRHTYSSVEVIDLATRKIRLTIDDPTVNTRISLSDDDRYVALAGSPARIYDTTDGSLVKQIAVPADATDVDFDPTNGDRLAVGLVDGGAQIVDWRAGSVIALRRQGDLVRVVRFSSDGRLLATATGPKESAVRIWDGRTGSLAVDNIARRGTVVNHEALAFDAGSTRLASVDRLGVGRVWSTDGTLISQSEKAYGFSALNAVVFAGPNTVMGGGPTGLLQRWEASTGHDLGAIEPHAGLVTSLDIDTSGRLLAVGGNRQLALFDLTGESPAHTVESYPPSLAAVASAGVPVIASFDQTGRRVLAAAGASVWAWDRGVDNSNLQPLPPPRPGLIVTGGAISSDGRSVLLSYFDLVTSSAELHIVDFSSGALAKTLPFVRVPVFEVSPDGRWLAVSDMAYPNAPQFWLINVDTGERTSLIDDISKVTEDVDPVRGDHVQTIAFSADSTMLVAANHRGAAVIWDAATHQVIGGPLAVGDGQVMDTTFSPDGTVIATVGVANVIEIRDVATRTLIGGGLEGAGGLALSMTFNPRDGRLLSGGSDGIRLWDPRAGIAVGNPFPTPSWSAFQWLPDGTGFVASTSLGLETWQTDPALWRRAACALAGRNLSDDEWHLYGTAEASPPTCNVS